MRVIRAEVMGMCPGVRGAIRRALALESPHEVTIFGELVHNEEVLQELAERGFSMDSESCRWRIPSTPKVLIPAHGVSQCETRRLEAAGKQLIDATCPLVRQIHQTAQHLARQGYFVIVIGKRNHAEVEGIAGDLDQHDVVSSADGVRRYGAKRLGVLCQSTTSPTRAERIVAEIRTQNPGKDIRYVPTICQATRDRQAAVLSLLDHVDALVVVGGTKSNNTLELVQLARSHEAPCFHIQTADDILPEWFGSTEAVGLTAGASTPDGTIEEVHEMLLKLKAEEKAPALARV